MKAETKEHTCRDGSRFRLTIGGNHIARVCLWQYFQKYEGRHSPVPARWRTITHNPVTGEQFTYGEGAAGKAEQAFNALCKF
jgi:hypothetical protein